MSIHSYLSEVSKVLNRENPGWGDKTPIVADEIDYLAHTQCLPSYDMETLEYLLRTTLEEFVQRRGA